MSQILPKMCVNTQCPTYPEKGTDFTAKGRSFPNEYGMAMRCVCNNCGVWQYGLVAEHEVVRFKLNGSFAPRKR
jgi:hypothetical protein